MKKRTKGIIAALMVMVASANLVFPSMAAYDLNGNAVEVSVEELTKDAPEALVKWYYENGGKIAFSDNDLSVTADGVVKARYQDTGDGYLITVSLDDYSSMLPHYFNHEMGHWLYDVTTRSEEDNAVIASMVERWSTNGAFTGINTTEKEIFAHMYANYVGGNGYGLTEDEKEMFGRLEDQVKDSYYAAHPEIDRAAEEAKEAPDYANMPDWKLASYGPEIWNTYR